MHRTLVYTQGQLAVARSGISSARTWASGCIPTSTVHGQPGASLRGAVRVARAADSKPRTHSRMPASRLGPVPCRTLFPANVKGGNNTRAGVMCPIAQRRLGLAPTLSPALWLVFPLSDDAAVLLRCCPENGRIVHVPYICRYLYDPYPCPTTDTGIECRVIVVLNVTCVVVSCRSLPRHCCRLLRTLALVTGRRSSQAVK